MGRAINIIGRQFGGIQNAAALINYKAAMGAGASSLEAYLAHVSPLPASRAAKLARIAGSHMGWDVQVSTTDKRRTVKVSIGTTQVLDHSYNRRGRLINKIGVAAISSLVGIALGTGAWRLGRLALGNLAKLNVGSAILQGGASAALASLGPKVTSRAFGQYGKLAARWAGYGLIANTAWNVYNLLPGPKDVGRFVSRYSTVRIARSPTADEIVKKFMRDREK